MRLSKAFKFISKPKIEAHLKNNKIKLDEWILKSTSEKAVVLSKIEEDLEGLSIQKAKAKENLENIIKGGLICINFIFSC
jgi:dsDNA-binding SOS-regulon protein